ncbi:hypothetical protein HDV00_003731 [Rhizophlyctis rosea]|nr:hypothetical protein HDV00_003731 [Rhizophlyctis rosea]
MAAQNSEDVASLLNDDTFLHAAARARCLEFVLDRADEAIALWPTQMAGFGIVGEVLRGGLRRFEEDPEALGRVLEEFGEV